MMNPMIVKVWDKFKPYVEYERQRRHEIDYYRQVCALDGGLRLADGGLRLADG